MLSKINSVRFASTNTYTNQNKSPKTQYSQQSFGKSPSKTLTLIGAFIMSLGAMGTNAAEKAAKKIKPNPKLDAICRKCEPLEATSLCLIDVPKEFQAPGGDIVTLRMNKAIVEDFAKLRAAAKEELGVDLVIRSAYRDDEYLPKVNEEMKKRVGIEGADIFLVDDLEHRTGCSLDVTTIKPKDEESSVTITDIRDDGFTYWLGTEGQKYEFKVPNKIDYTQHIEYTGEKQKPPVQEQQN